MATRKQLHRAIDELPESDLESLAAFIGYLRFKSDGVWMQALLESFSHVQEAVEAAQMDEDELNTLIAEAVQEVRDGEQD